MTTDDFDLAALWRQASTMPFHGAGCGCAAPMVVAPKPEDFELDVLDYVTDKRGLDRIPAWAQAMSEREAARVGSFTAWLEATCSACLDEALHAQVIADVVGVLDSRVTHAAGRFSSPTVKGAGWLTSPSARPGPR